MIKKLVLLVLLTPFLISCGASSSNKMIAIIEYDKYFTDSTYKCLYQSFEDLQFKKVGSEVKWEKNIFSGFVSISGDIKDKKIILNFYNKKNDGVVMISKNTRKKIQSILLRRYGQFIQISTKSHTIPLDVSLPILFYEKMVPCWELNDRYIILLEYDSDDSSEDYYSIIVKFK
jgi:major membrane immunogen (membrane-anchored lipoprotein)